MKWNVGQALLIAALVAGCGSQERPPEGTQGVAPPASVRAEPVATLAIAQQTRAVGVLGPREEIRLAFKVGGIVERVAVDAGDTVAKGQLLAEIKQAEVAASVAQAREAAEKARRDLERARRLRADEVATEEQVENLVTGYNVAQSQLQAARFNARFARVEAPVEGIVFERLVEAGELVQAGQPILVLGATGSGWVVRAGLADRDAVRVRAGAPVEVVFDAYPGRTFAGRVSRVGAAADRQTGTFEIEVEVEPEGVRFARGLVAKVVLPLSGRDEQAPGATVVPVSALVEANGDRGVVFVIDREHGVARRKDVRIGPLFGERVVVTAGLDAGEAVVTEGATWLSEGRAVREVDAGQG